MGSRGSDGYLHRAMAVAQAAAVAWPGLRPRAADVAAGLLLASLAPPAAPRPALSGADGGALPPLALRLLLHLSALGQAPAACRAVARAAAPANSDGPPLAPQLARGFAIQLAALAAPPYSREVHNASGKRARSLRIQSCGIQGGPTTPQNARKASFDSRGHFFIARKHLCINHYLRCFFAAATNASTFALCQFEAAMAELAAASGIAGSPLQLGI
jgi:hypothetical protein